MTETKLQIELVNWLHRTHPKAWEWTHHSPNGGHRHKAIGQQMKLMGTRKGVPDLLTFLPSGKYRGLAVELKTETGKPSADQIKWLNHFGSLGWSTAICFTLEQAQLIYQNYLEG